ncbi:Lectin C-type domain family protein [Brugia pahangi]
MFKSAEYSNFHCKKHRDCRIDQICEEEKCMPDLLPILAMKETNKQHLYCNTNYHCKSWQKCMNGICVQSFEHLATTNDLETLIVPPFKLKPMKFDAKEKINNQTTNTTEFQTLKMAKSDEQSESEELEETETEELSETVAQAIDVAVSQIPNEEITEVMNVTEFETIIETGTVSDYHTLNTETDSWTLEKCDSSADCKKSQICQDGLCHNSHSYTKLCDSLWWQFRQKCYLPIHGRFTHSEGSDYCTKFGAHLVTIRDTQQANYVNYIYDIGGNGTYWIGLIKDINGTLKWQSDESMIYTNWSEGEPEPRIGCVITNTVIHNGKWSITDCSDLQYPDQGFVCEMDIRSN